MGDSDEDYDDEYDKGSSTLADNHHYQGEVINVSDELARVLNSMDLEGTRGRPVRDEDDDQLRTVHQRLLEVVEYESDDTRKRKLKATVLHSCKLREQILYLRRLRRGSTPIANYFIKTNESLSFVYKETYDEGFRRASIDLGVVDACAELLVMEVELWGAEAGRPNEMGRNERREIRKQIASVLTNLTFGHRQTKWRLCSYNGFIPTVIRIISKTDNLVQPYSNLLRNMSWMLDRTATEPLWDATQPLARAAMRARAAVIEAPQSVEEEKLRMKCVHSAIAALWNIVPHSPRNMRAICEEEGFIEMLLGLCTSDGNTSIVECATGVLKYAAHELKAPQDGELRRRLLRFLFPHIRASSFVIVKNVLGAISVLIANDYQLLVRLRENAQYMHLLESLLNSQKEEIRGLVKEVLRRVMAVTMPVDSGIFSQPRSMTSSLHTDRFAHLRVRDTFSPSLDTRSSSLPRGFRRITPSHQFDNGAQSPFGLLLPSQPSPHQTTVHPAPPPPMQQPLPEDDHNDNEYNEEDDSVRPTRSNSINSIGSCAKDLSGLQSVVETADNSARLSPVSYSDLPDSPTQCATLPEYSTKLSGGSSEASTADAVPTTLTTPFVSQQATPTFPSNQIAVITGYSDASTRRQDSEEDYVVFEGGSELLDRSIEGALPPKKNNNENELLLSLSIADAMPRSPARQRSPAHKGMSPRYGTSTPRSTSIGMKKSKKDDFLLSAIQSAMPSSSNSLLTPKNAWGECPEVEKDTQGPCRPESTDGEENQEDRLSSDSFECEYDVEGGETGDVPRDVRDEMEAGVITIDCSRVAARPVRSRLPAPVSHRIPTRPKAAIVTPYNYCKPKPLTEEKKKEKEKTGKGARLLVTTV